jgi:acyl dehydratase
MTETQEEERLYTWEIMEEGHTVPPISMEVTREFIADYCKSVQDDNPIYCDDDAAKAAGLDGAIAPPTMAHAYAPMRRWDIMEHLGYVGPERSKNPRSTPFAGSEMMFQGVPVRPGDMITSQPTVDRKWISNSGNKFVAFRVVGHNQKGEKVVEYLYSIIWEYSRGQKSRTT